MENIYPTILVLYISGLSKTKGWNSTCFAQAEPIETGHQTASFNRRACYIRRFSPLYPIITLRVYIYIYIYVFFSIRSGLTRAVCHLSGPGQLVGCKIHIYIYVYI